MPPGIKEKLMAESTEDASAVHTNDDSQGHSNNSRKENKTRVIKESPIIALDVKGGR